MGKVEWPHVEVAEARIITHEQTDEGRVWVVTGFTNVHSPLRIPERELESLHMILGMGMSQVLSEQRKEREATEEDSYALAVPEGTLQSMRAYADERASPGGFLGYVFRNQLVDAALVADSTNGPALAAIAQYLWHRMPLISWGSERKVNWWLGHKYHDGKADPTCPHCPCLRCKGEAGRRFKCTDCDGKGVKADQSGVEMSCLWCEDGTTGCLSCHGDLIIGLPDDEDGA